MAIRASLGQDVGLPQDLDALATEDLDALHFDLQPEVDVTQKNQSTYSW